MPLVSNLFSWGYRGMVRRVEGGTEWLKVAYCSFE